MVLLKNILFIVKYLIGIFFVIYFSFLYVYAHGGRLDSKGCHSGSRAYHCHDGISSYRNYNNVGHKNNIESKNILLFLVSIILLFFIYYNISKLINRKKEKELEIVNFVRNKYITRLVSFKNEILINKQLEEKRIKNLVENSTKIKQIFSFEYTNNAGVKSTRKIKPQSTNQSKGTVYGFCFLREEKRHFKIKKISNFKIE